MSRRALAAALALLALLVGAPSAFAHATLESSAPQRGATLGEQPSQVLLTFDEPVQATEGALRVFDARARRVDEGSVLRPGGEGERVAVALRPRLAEGTYTATFRVVSADGHLVTGGLTFSVGRPTAAASSVDELLAGQRAGPVTQAALGVARAVSLAAIALALGGVLFLAVVWPPALRAGARDAAAASAARARDGFGARALALLGAAAALGALSTASGLVLAAASSGGVTAWEALDARLLGDLLETRFGGVWALRLALWLVLAAGLALAAARVRGERRRAAAHAPDESGAHGLAPLAGGSQELAASPAGAAGPLPGAALAAAGALAALLALTPALAGHASTESPAWLLIPADVAHVVAMSAWLGGLTMLLLAVPAATRALQPAQRSRLLAAALNRFSPIALAAVATLALTGVVQAVAEVGSFGALVDSGFGRAVLAKSALLGVLAAISAVNRRRVVPAMRRLAAGGEPPGAAGRLLRRTLRAEIALIAAVLAVTGVLTGISPPSSAQPSGPVSVAAPAGPLLVELTVDPARVGTNALHVYLLRARDGAAFAGALELHATASLPARAIGPLDLRLRRAGPGHYVGDGVALGVAGDWQIDVHALVSEFDAHSAQLTVAIR